MSRHQSEKDSVGCCRRFGRLRPVFLIFGLVINGFFSGTIGGQTLSLARLFLLGLISAVVSEIGDLIGSVIKRQYDIKDFGTLLPGHGGILDRCDSIITVAPMIFLFLTEIGIIG